MTVLTGRRRVGKTALVRQALGDGRMPYVHLPITRQPEVTLCEQLQAECEEVLHLDMHGTCQRFGELFKELMAESVKRPFTLVLDEFQEFDRTNPGVYGDIQAVWDRYHQKSKVNLIVSGSVNRLMNKIFFNYGEPLYGRNTAHLRLHPFPASLMKEIFAAHYPKYTKKDLLALWTMTGGVARYVSLFMDARCYTQRKMIDLFFSEASPFLEEGRSILIQEFGNDYVTYFTILTAIATGHTKFAEIKNDLGMDVGAYLSNLEKNYGLIRKVNPIFSEAGSKNSIFHITDPFLRFWFRYVFKCAPYVERGLFERLRKIVSEDFEIFSGTALEQYFEWKFTGEQRYSGLGRWWDRKGENEIDLVGEDDLSGTLDFYEIKRARTAIDLAVLEGKTSRFFEKHPQKAKLARKCLPLSLEDM